MYESIQCTVSIANNLKTKNKHCAYIIIMDIFINQSTFMRMHEGDSPIAEWSKVLQNVCFLYTYKYTGFESKQVSRINFYMK